MHGQIVFLEVSFSVGVSHGMNTDAAGRLLSEAGFAMREAKRSPDNVATFGEELAERLDRTIEVAGVASGTTGDGTFVPVAQAIISR